MTTVIEFYIDESERKNNIKNLTQYINKTYCKSVEQGIYDYTKQYCESNENNLVMSTAIYKDCAKNLIFNFEKNSKTMQNILSLISGNAYNAYNLAFLRPEELDNENWEKIISRQQLTEDKLTNLPAVEWKPCVVCKSNKYNYRLLQTRSSDEPMTIFYTCTECDKTYKVNN